MQPQHPEWPTLSVLKLPLDHGVVDVGQDDQIVEVLLHAPYPGLLVGGAAAHGRVLFHDVPNALLLRFDGGQLLLPVLQQDLARLLEALVGELLKGHFWRLVEAAAEGCTTTPRPDGLDMVSPQQTALLLLVLDHFRVEDAPFLHVLGRVLGRGASGRGRRCV